MNKYRQKQAIRANHVEFYLVVGSGLGRMVQASGYIVKLLNPRWFWTVRSEYMSLFLVCIKSAVHTWTRLRHQCVVQPVL
jgi:hypothetical protein